MVKSLSTNRRNILKSVSSVISIGALAGYSTARKGVNTTEIVVARSYTGDEVIESVPTDWYDHVINVRSATQKAQEEFSDDSNVKSISSEFSKETIEGMYKNYVSIEVNSLEDNSKKASSNYTDSINGVDVKVKEYAESDTVEGTSDNCSPALSRDYSSLPGGVKIDSGTSNLYGTAGYTVRKDGVWYMVTAAHIWGECSGKKITGEPAEQNNQDLGYVASSSVNLDYVVVRANHSITLDDQIRELTDRRDVTHWVTEGGLETYGANGRQVYKMGVTTGRTKGQILQTHKNGGPECIDLNGKGFETNCNTSGGDSGGPTYIIRDNGDIHVIGSTTYGNTWLGTSVGCTGNRRYEASGGLAAYHLHRQGYDAF